MRTTMGDMLQRRLGWQIEKYILLSIIVLSIIDFLGYLPIFYAYILDVVGWTSIAYVIYAVSPTELFFGERDGHIDILAVIAYVIMGVKELIGNAIATLPDLIITAPTYIHFKASEAAVGIPIAITDAEMNAWLTLKIIPEHLATGIAQNLTMMHQEVDIFLQSASTSAMVKAIPTTLDGSMLMFYNTIVLYTREIQMYSLIIGVLILIGVSVYAAKKLYVKKPSVMSVLKEEGRPFIVRIILAFLLFIGFFIMIFNLLFEWMTITNDAPVLVIMLVMFALFYFAHTKGLTRDKFFEELGNSVSDFYETVIRLFMNSKTVLLGISGFLVLHLITDIGNFLIPSVLGWYETIYIRHAPGFHLPLYQMIMFSFNESMLQNSLIVLTYLWSTLGIAFLLALPGWIWYKLFKIRSTQSHEHLPDLAGWKIGLILSSIAVYYFVPVFQVSAFTEGGLVGVNLTSLPLSPGDAPTGILVLAIIILLGCILAAKLHDYTRKLLMLGPFLAAVFFFGFYIYHYFASSFTYYITQIIMLAKDGTYLLLPIFGLFFLFTTIFFITGFLSFLYELWRD